MDNLINELQEIIKCIQYYHINEPKSSKHSFKKDIVENVSKLEQLLLNSIFYSIYAVTSKKMLSDLFLNYGNLGGFKPKGENVIVDKWDDFLKLVFMGAFYLSRNEYRMGSLCLTKSLDKFSDKIWDNDAYKVIVFKDFLLRLCKICVQKAKEADGKGDPYSKECNNALASTLMHLRNRTGRDREDDKRISKKIAILPILNFSFLVYFRIDNISLSESILKNAIESKLFYPFEINDYSKADRIKFNYYSGKISYFTSNYKEASYSLMNAFKETPSSHIHNKKLILRNLICVNLMLGKYPPKSLLIKYGMDGYINLIRSCAVGDLKTFSKELEKNQIYWIKNGTYLILERSKIIAYRNFFKKVYLILQESFDSKIPLEEFQNALKTQGISIDELELEGLLSSLIHLGFINGYISHAYHKIVLAKTVELAFPPIQDQYKRL